MNHIAFMTQVFKFYETPLSQIRQILHIAFAMRPVATSIGQKNLHYAEGLFYRRFLA